MINPIAEDATSFLLIVNSDNECGMATIADDGSLLGWRFGNIAYVLQEKLRRIYPGAVVLCPSPHSIYSATMGVHLTIESLLTALNSKDGMFESGFANCLYELGLLDEFVEETDDGFVAKKSYLDWLKMNSTEGETGGNQDD